MSKKKKFLIASAIVGMSAPSVLANEKQHYINVSAEYAQSYFEYLEFKQTAPAKIESVKSSLSTTGAKYRQVKAEYDRERDLYNTLNNEFVAIPGKITGLQTKKQNSIEAIPALKQSAKAKGLFSPSENPDQDLSQEKINSLKQIVMAKESQISTLEANIAEIEARPEWQTLSFERSTKLRTLNAKKQNRINKENEIQRLSSRINTLENEIRNIQNELFQLDERKDFIDSHLPNLVSQNSQVSVELNNKNNEVFSAEDQLSQVNRRISALQQSKTRMERDLRNAQQQLRSAQNELNDINSTLNNVPSLQAELSDIEGKLRKQNRSVNNKENEKSGKQSRLQGLQSDLTSAQAELRRLNQQISSLQNGQGNQSSQIAALESQIAQKQQQAAELPNLMAEKQQVETQIAAIDDQIAQGEARLIEIANKLIANEELTEQERKQFRRLAKRIYDANPNNPKKFAIRVVGGALDSNNGRLAKSKVALQDKVNELVNGPIQAALDAENAIAGLQQQIANLQSGSSNNQSEISALIAQRDAVQGTINSLNSQINPLQSEIDVLTGEINELNRKISSNEKRKNEIQSSLSNINDLTRRKLALEQRQIPALNSTIATLTEDLRVNSRDMRRANSRRDNLVGELNVLRRQRDRLQSEFNSLNNQISSLGSERQNIVNRISSLNRQMSLSESELTVKRSDLFTVESELSVLNAEIPGLQTAYNIAQSNYDNYYDQNQGPHQSNINNLTGEIRTHNSDIRAYNNLIDDLNMNEQIIAESTAEIATLEARKIVLGPQVEAQTIVFDEVEGRYKTAESAYNNDLVRLDRLTREWNNIRSEAKNLEARTEQAFRRR